ncbi:MerR family transcriptional regulator [Saccharopolyspora antimicrobica]|uniref:MerR family transcriptional regulator n=1 Tax=Saccharopolyspora antimicrobica TaxID=455193 RepID=UPI000B87DEAB
MFRLPIGKSPQTVRRWESEGRITAKRAPAGQRYFTETDVLTVLQSGVDVSSRKTFVHRRSHPRGRR